MRIIFSPVFKFFSMVLIGVALATPAADAAPRKQPAAKKTVVSKRAVTTQKVVSPRRAAQSAHKRTKTRSADTSKVALRKGSGRAAKRILVTSARKPAIARAIIPARQSFGDLAGLHEQGPNPLALHSAVALVIDQETHEVLLSKNDHAVLPIASLTKLMTGLLISEARLPMDAPITITQDDVDTEKNSRSRLAVGTTLSRRQMLHLALMSSENRAAHALGRTYPGGMEVFVAEMNAKAAALGMKDTLYVEPTGLSSSNQSSARDLAILVDVTHNNALMRGFTTSPGYEVAVGRRTLQYNNTNRLVKDPEWEIGLQKTGYISEAGRCLVMQAEISGRKVIMVFLDSAGKLSRLADAERVRSWVESKAALASGAHTASLIKG